MVCTLDSETKQTGLDDKDKALDAAKAAAASQGLNTAGWYSDGPPEGGRNYEFSPFVSLSQNKIYYFKPSHGNPNSGNGGGSSFCTPPGAKKTSGHLTRICWCEPRTTTTTTTTTPRGNGGKAAGDPHLLNIKGERFNINRQGYAPLVSIASDGAANLEVMALIEGVKKCQKKMFITEVNASGIWLEKNIAVTIGTDKNQAFRVTVDRQEVWSPATEGYEPPTTENVIVDHGNKFSINEVTASAATSKTPGVELKTARGIKMKIMRPMVRASAPPHLNFDITGLAKLPPSFKLGGLLGHDDHTYWSTPDPDCAANYVRSAEAQVEDSRATAQ